jgi:hypothetical protein
MTKKPVNFLLKIQQIRCQSDSTTFPSQHFSLQRFSLQQQMGS